MDCGADAATFTGKNWIAPNPVLTGANACCGTLAFGVRAKPAGGAVGGELPALCRCADREAAVTSKVATAAWGKTLRRKFTAGARPR